MPNTGLNIPRWAIFAATFITGLFSAGWTAKTIIHAEVTSEVQTQMREWDLRLCRIEERLGIPPWSSCQIKGK